MADVTTMAQSTRDLLVSITRGFSSLRFSRSLDADFVESQTRLDVLLLRLTRWGISTTLFPSSSPAPATFPAIFDIAALQQAYDDLTDLAADMVRVQEESKYHGRNMPSAGVYTLRDQPAHLAKLSAWAHQTAERRCKASGVSQMGVAEWTLFDRNRMDFLFGWAAETLHRVETLFDHTVDVQRQLCRAELKEACGLGGDAATVVKAMEEAITTEVRADWDVCLGFEAREALKAMK